MPGFTPEDFTRMLTNPFYCINIAEKLFAEHEAMVSEEQIDCCLDRASRNTGQKRS